MNLNKAIEILDHLPIPLRTAIDHDGFDALKLGIEALKEVTCLRSTDRTLVRPLLPGETKD